MINETNELRLSSTGKSAKKRRQGVVTGDEEASDEDDEEEDLYGSEMAFWLLCEDARPSQCRVSTESSRGLSV